MKRQSSSLGLAALSLFATLVLVVAANVASAQLGDATAPADGTAPAAAGDLTGAAKVGSGVAVDSALQGGDLKASGQKGLAAGVDTYRGGTPAAPAAAAPAAEPAPAGE